MIADASITLSKSNTAHEFMYCFKSLKAISTKYGKIKLDRIIDRGECFYHLNEKRELVEF